jgi:hypothetical protein
MILADIFDDRTRKHSISLPTQLCSKKDAGKNTKYSHFGGPPSLMLWRVKALSMKKLCGYFGALFRRPSANFRYCQICSLPGMAASFVKCFGSSTVGFTSARKSTLRHLRAFSFLVSLYLFKTTVKKKINKKFAQSISCTIFAADQLHKFIQ